MGRILIADDHDSLRRGLAQALSDGAHDVDEAPNGNAAIERLHDAAFDVVVSDLRMGGSTGLEVLKTAKSLQPTCAVILMTAFGSISTAVEAMRAGAFDFVQKPFEIEEMEVKIEKALEVRRLKHEIDYLRHTQQDIYDFDKIVGSSASLQRAQKANQEGWFAWEIAPVALKSGKGDRFMDKDEQPFKANFDKIPQLKPAFRKDGTVTAANSSSISDGAAALVLMRRSTAHARGLTPIATIMAHTTHAQEPGWFTTAPVAAIRKLYEKTGWSAADVDLYEINEAFAVVTLAAMREHGLPHDKVNVHGGACALGHPIGASGARILVTLLGALRKYGLKRGVASLCIGGGEATAMAVELY